MFMQWIIHRVKEEQNFSSGEIGGAAALLELALVFLETERKCCIII